MPTPVRGVSLIELLACLAVVAIASAVGLPAMTGLMERQRASTVSNRVLAELHHARLAAVIRRKQVTLCPSRDGVACHPGPDWSSGMLTLVPQGSGTDGPTALRALPGSDLKGMTLRSSVGRPRLMFRPDGRAGGSNLSLSLCDRRGGLARRIIVSNGGRARVESPKAPAPCPAGGNTGNPTARAGSRLDHSFGAGKMWGPPE